MDLQSRPSSSSSSRIWKHDVFVSFRDEDTCDFTHYLSAALDAAGLTTFSFDRKLKMGDTIPPQFLEEIEESHVYIVVLSQNYAASTYCLDELAKIADCIKVRPLSVVPIFYDVDPSEVRNSWYEKYFARHEGKFRLNLVQLRRLWQARKLVAQCEGLVVQYKIDPRVIDKIVKKTMEKLGHNNAAIGIQSRVQKLEKLLDLGSYNDVRFVGICGMGGIGKTTLATAVYDKISHHFDACCFLANVSRHSAKPYGLSYLRGKLLRKTPRQRYVNTTDNLHSSLSLTRTLIVLDDVDELKQLEALAGNREWFGAGSRIIITTRDQHILKLHGVDGIFKVELLNKDEAFRLFCTTAFTCDDLMSGYDSYEEMTHCALEYASGLPLAIKSLGSSLLNRSVSEWGSALVKLHKNPHKSILRVLKRSFDGLLKMEKLMFLDIACFFVGEEINYVKEILRSLHGLNIEDRIRVLVDKSLIIISDERIQMHYMLQKMGQEIVRRQSHGELESQRNLWLYDDIRQVMEKNTESKHVQAIVLLNQDDPEGTPLNVEGLSQMSDLRLLIFRNVNFAGRLDCLSNKLRYLSWHKYPFTCLPLIFDPRELVELIMPDSCITQLWGSIKWLPKLRSLNLGGSKHLTKTPDFEGLPNLERVDLEGCTSLLHLHPSIARLRRIKFLNLRNCTSLVSIPNNLFGQSSLEFLNLAGCSQLAQCLSFNNLLSLKSLIKVKLHSIQFPPFLAKLL